MRRSKEWWADVLPTGGNTEIADRYNLDRGTVRKWRKRLGIPLPDSLGTPFSTTPAGPPSTQRSSRGIIPPDSRPPTTPLPSVSVDVSSHGITSDPYASANDSEHRILFIPDVHVPYHSKLAWRTALAVAQHWQPTAIVVLGDFLDLMCVSSHPKKPGVALSLEHEISAGRECLDQVDALGARYRYYVAGNHEARLNRYIAKHAPMFDDLLSVRELLGLDERGWRHTPYGDGLTLGELYITHDLGLAGKYAVRRSVDAAWQSTVIGHVHRAEVVYQKNALGKVVKGASFGWLGEPKYADYMKVRVRQRQWTHAVGICHMDASGKADISVVPIENGRCRVEGHVVTADDYSPSRTAA